MTNKYTVIPKKIPCPHLFSDSANIIYYLINRLSIYFFTLLISSPLFSQDYVYKHYNVEDGLPSSEVHYVFQDSKGYMWFGTDGGVSKFNGYEFETFDTSDGLTDNTVFQIYEDVYGRIWFGTFNLQLSYYLDGKIYPYQHNDKLKAYKNNVLTSFYIDEDTTVWLGLRTNLLKIKNGEIETLKHPQEKSELSLILTKSKTIIYGMNGIIPFHKVSKNFSKKDDNFSLRLNFLNLNKNELKSHSFDLKEKSSFRYTNYIFKNIGTKTLFYRSPDYSYILDWEKPDTLKKLNNIPLIKNYVLSIFYANQHFWFCTKGQGIFEFEIKKESITLINKYLKEKEISRGFMDNTGGIWFCTLSEGVYYLSSNNIKTSFFNSENVKRIEIDTLNNIIYSCLQNGEIYKIRNKDSIALPYQIYKTLDGNSIFKMDNTSSTLFFNGAGKDLSTLKSYKNNTIKEVGKSQLKLWGNFKDLFFENDTLYVASGLGMNISVDNKIIYNSRHKNTKLWGTCILKDKNKVWMGTNAGIYIYENGELKSPFKKNKYLSSAIKQLGRLNKEIILVGTKSYGLLVIRNDSIIDIIDETSGLAGNLVKSIHIDSEKIIWVGTNKGLSQIRYNAKNNYQIYNINTNHGLISNEINDISSYRDLIYVATSKGLNQFNKTKLKENLIKPPLYITSFNVNEIEQKLNSTYQLSYQENNINITFEALNYRSFKNIKYKYRLIGVDTNWIETSMKNVRYPALTYNKYKFEVKASNEDGHWSNPVILSFTIHPPFWLTWSFIILTITIIIGFIIVLFRSRLKQVKKKGAMEKRLIQLELKALRSQMNPHFIFNTLNSIQYYIGESNFKETNRYITKFSKLIRTVLNVSEKETITIQEEIEMLTLYLDLEQMRFEKQFNYEITVSKDLDTDYDKIPSMLIQPYVENAIWHGLMNKKEKGEIKINISLDTNFLKCTITDNGIGRYAAQKIKENRNINHKSVGMTITKERLDLLNDNLDSTINIEINDLYKEKDNLKEALGTKVTIKIPF